MSSYTIRNSEERHRLGKRGEYANGRCREAFKSRTRERRVGKFVSQVASELLPYLSSRSYSNRPVKTNALTTSLLAFVACAYNTNVDLLNMDSSKPGEVGVIAWCNSFRFQLGKDPSREFMHNQIQEKGFDFLDTYLENILAKPTEGYVGILVLYHMLSLTFG